MTISIIIINLQLYQNKKKKLRFRNIFGRKKVTNNEPKKKLIITITLFVNKMSNLIAKFVVFLFIYLK